jgi:hypothetical protein
MSEAKHTPGPWHSQECYIPTPTDLGYENGDRYMMALVYSGDDDDERGIMEGSVICRMSDMPGEEQNANAHLIAAAPDLLEAADYLIHSIGKSGWVDASPLVAERRARVGEVNALRAAIARAKGKGS